jgi:hypothetical protein
VPALVDPVLAISLPISGLINPFFLITAAYAELKPSTRTTAILKVIVVLMFSACWMVFYHDQLRPREGYFVWLLGMLLVLLSSQGSIRAAESREYSKT